ncbi:MAG: hypothetical protein ACTHK3_10560 [Solirubrobacterales bacterium]
MKYLKMLGLAAVAAMAVMAFFGASSASATVLCTTTTAPCGTGWHVDKTVGTAIGSTSLHSTGGALEATCTESSSTAEKSTTGSSTTTPVGTVAKAGLTWGGCNQITETLEGGELEIHQIAGTHNGTVTAKGFKVTVVIGGLSCTFGAGTGIHLGVLTGGDPAILHANAVVNKVAGGFLCPADSVWEATYQITNHTSVYVVAS